MKFFGILLLLLLLAAAAAAYIVYTPYGPTTETFVDIPPGTGATAIAARLRKDGIIRSRYAFDSPPPRAKAAPSKPANTASTTPSPPPRSTPASSSGDVYTQALTIPEGYNIFDIARPSKPPASPNATPSSPPSASTPNSSPTSYPPNAHPASLEGYLFPDTYRFSRHATPLQILTAMVHRFRQAATQLGLDRPTSPHTVTMASLIEKEVGQDTERPLVAGVFINRLAKSMPLATDPTVIYAALLDNRWRGTIYASDLQSPSPYNTYKHTGLPPGPISNPGMAALRAALHPAQTDYLYFVSDAAGHTRFSVGLKEHAQQVQAYRQARKALNSAATAPHCLQSP